MAKVSGPLLSLSATGAIGKAQVYSSWRGVAYARRYVVPSNPKSVEQTVTRNTFAASDDQYKRSLALAQESWEASARGRPYTGRNAYIREYVRRLRGELNFTNYISSPGVNGGLPLPVMSATPTAVAGELQLDATIPALPVGWTHDRVVWTWFPDRDPALRMTGFVDELDDPAAGWTVGPPQHSDPLISGLTSGIPYVVSAYLVSTRADGKIAYGLGSTVLATPL